MIVDRTSKWGNPFTVADAIKAGHTDPQRACVSNFEAWIDGDPTYPDTYTVGARVFDRRWMRAHLHELRGKDLCCPCGIGEPCHGDSLIRRVTLLIAAGGAS
ncbi:uncharacterized protein DUF4326 [Allonocardiopsis opalescens]|uniref:Uncharacterized protein DUF4326 n=1 Tax=Allonocardiopsis opalescens TaxID=1144618 RepID=A0A2T0PSR0_9ACTN|nr:uncharacterized protein DUF4326 [Allonocardiopsis opalescens]